MQIYGVNYFDTFSPVAKLSSFCTILVYAICHNWEIESFDFNGAYLNGKLDNNEEIFMQEPPGYKTGSGGSLVKRLQKLLYGLKQARQKWYDALCCILVDLGFHISNADLGVFHAHVEGNLIILAIHVDNCTMTGSSPKLIASYKGKLNELTLSPSLIALTSLMPSQLPCQ